MNLYYISADTKGYDVYRNAVVAANTEEEARYTHPSGTKYDYDWWDDQHPKYFNYSWVYPEQVKVELIGVACVGTEAGVICSDFNAG